MLYDLSHRVTYTYETPVPESHQIIRMLPVSRLGQRVVAASLSLDPAPVERKDLTDFYGNAVVGVVIDSPHEELVVETRGRVALDHAAPPAPETAPAWEEVRRDALSAGGLEPDSPVHFNFDTFLVPLLADIAAYARQSFPTGRPITEAAAHLAARIRADFRYDPEATDVATPIRASFDARAGVCQDFAHIMLSGLRGLGIPGRYVSGYLRTNPPPGRPRLEGADATHAWVDVWCGGGLGWIGFDPTNAVMALNDHIVLAIGRDYSDVAPIEGVIRLYGGHGLKVAVDVVPVEE